MSDWPYSYQPDDTSPESPDRSPSPQTDLLSPVYDGALEHPTSRRRSIPHGPTERFCCEGERVHSATSKRDLIKALINEEYESKQTRRVLSKAYDQFRNETCRATEAEGWALEAAQRYRSLNESKILAQREAVKVKEELRLYKLQLENAQKEIDKAQDILRAVEEQRDDADAARARDTARRLNEAQLVEQAREEGRRLGFEEGIKRSRELGFDDGRTYEADYNRGNTSSGSLPRIITTPQVVRAPSLPLKDRTPLRTRKDSASSSRRGLPSLTPLPLSPPRRPASLNNEPLSPRHLSGITLPPDNWIPTADQAHFIAMPPREMQRTPEPMSTTRDADSIRSRTLGSVLSPSDLHHHTSLDSQASTNHSKASTALSQLDLVTPPYTAVGRNGGRPGLSVILEDTSSQRSPNGSIRDRSIHSDHRMPFQTPDLVRAASDRDTDSPSQLQEAWMRDKRLNQKMADELRYSDPNQVEEWRRNGLKEAQSNQNAPPRRQADDAHLCTRSARTSIGHLLINIDISMSAMITGGNLIEVAMDVLNVRNQHDLWLSKDHHNFKKLKNFFKNVFIRVKPSGHKKQIRDLQEFAGEYKFNKDNGPTTVERHFSEVYNISLRQPKIFGIATGSKERKVVYPAELCLSVVYFATKTPQEQLHIINNGIGLGRPGGLAAPALEYETSPFIQDAGMMVSATPLTIKGNVIVPPQLAFSPQQLSLEAGQAL
ncbi:hypothetical protein PILCRDRAFT_4615 [Piloderma croceum F 1598]|uniref:PAZ domain-containing protein n=1 Tax=Piloderma croceum (strain F 1598) TaxID=765440 RepID=A0A0C3G7T3_PILCF|nr:hypothetical protein PILCRDRAFT_4615 [Piloderma croceum F 1598]